MKAKNNNNNTSKNNSNNDKIFDLIEEQYTKSSAEQIVNLWERFFLRYNKGIKDKDDQTIIVKPYLAQIVAMASEKRLIYERQFGSILEHMKPVDEHETTVGRRIIRIDYSDLTYAKTDIFQMYEYDNPSDKGEIERTMQDIKILCYQIRYEWDAAMESISNATFNLLRKYNTRYSDMIGPADNIYVEVTNFELSRPITGRGSEDLDKFIRIPGIITRCDDQSSIEVKKTGYRCVECDSITQSYVRKPPRKCPACDKTRLEEEPKYRQTEDYMYFVLQDMPDKRREGQMMPDTIQVSCSGTDFVKSVYNIMTPGTQVAVNGVIRLSEIAKNNSQLFSVQFECFGIEILDQLGTSDQEIKVMVETQIPKENMTDHYHKMIRSIAPHIQGHELTKEACLLVAAGSSIMEDEKHQRIRNEINVLLMGDPGTAKTDFLHYMEYLMPGSNYIQGINASEVGLTATVKSDDILRAGQSISRTVLDPGVFGRTKSPSMVCFDEFDKVKSDFHYAATSTATDDFQVVRVDKQDIHTKINVNCGLLAAANPTTNAGMWDVTKTPFKQINFRHWMWDRFDLKLLHLQKRDKASRHLFWKQKEKNYAKIYLSQEEIMKKFSGKGSSNRKYDQEYIDSLDYYPIDYLRHEVMYVRKIQPTLRANTGAWLSMQIFWDTYNDMNMIPKDQVIENEGERVTFIPVLNERAIFSLTRLAQASARLHRRWTVELEDMEIAINLMKRSIGMFLPHINIEDENIKNRADAQVFLDEGIKESIRLATMHQAEIIKKYALGMRKLLQHMHRQLFQYCKECKATGHLIDKSLPNPSPDDKYMNEHIPCQNCYGRKGWYDRFSYIAFEQICKEAGILVNSESYFNLLKRCRFIKRFGENFDTTHLKSNMVGDFTVEKDLNGQGIVELFAEINKLFGVTEQTANIPIMVNASSSAGSEVRK